MAFSRDNLLKGFDQDDIIRWHPEMKNGKVAYDAVIESIKTGTLNERQMRNAFHALFRLRGWGDQQVVLDTYVDCSRDGRLAVRSEAVQLAIGLARFSFVMDNKRIVVSPEQENVLRTAMSVGLETEVLELAEKFFSKRVGS